MARIYRRNSMLLASFQKAIAGPAGFRMFSLFGTNFTELNSVHCAPLHPRTACIDSVFKE